MQIENPLKTVYPLAESAQLLYANSGALLLNSYCARTKVQYSVPSENYLVANMDGQDEVVLSGVSCVVLCTLLKKKEKKGKYQMLGETIQEDERLIL